MQPEFFTKMKPVNPMTYSEYRKLIAEEIAGVNTAELNEKELNLHNTRIINFQRITRLEKHFKLSDKLKNLAAQISYPQFWMIISESWCGDSAQNLPIIAKVADLNKNIQIKILLRDSNPHIMNKFLTNGSRSIPILVAFDYQGIILFKWGPRPKAAQELVKKLKAEGMGKDDFIKQLHLWYGRNRGKGLDNELADLLIQLKDK